MKHLRDNVKRLERDMEQHADQLQELEQQLADPEVYDSMATAELDALLAKAGKLRVSLETTEEDWLRACTALEEVG